MRTARVPAATTVAIAAAVALSGCAVGPERVAGAPAPLTAPTTAATPRPTPSRPAPVSTPTGTAVPPTIYAPYTLTAEGVRITVPVPAGWSLTPTTYGADFGDPSGRLLLRLEIRAKVADDAVKGWELYEPELSARLPGYERLGLVRVAGVGDSAADLSFTFTRGGGVRQVVDRSVVKGRASIAIYFSAEQPLFAGTRSVFDKAAGGLQITAA